MLHYISGHTFPSIGWESPVFNDILATFKFSDNTSHIKSPAFTSALIILRCDIIFHMLIQHIVTQVFKERKVWEVNLKAVQNFFELFFSFLH